MYAIRLIGKQTQRCEFKWSSWRLKYYVYTLLFVSIQLRVTTETGHNDDGDNGYMTNYLYYYYFNDTLHTISVQCVCVYRTLKNIVGLGVVTIPSFKSLYTMHRARLIDCLHVCVHCCCLGVIIIIVNFIINIRVKRVCRTISLNRLFFFLYK